MAAHAKKTIAKKMSKAEKAEAEAAKHRHTPQAKRARIKELEERARLFGDSAKQSAQAKVLERKWLHFLLVHGKAYGFKSRFIPTSQASETLLVIARNGPFPWAFLRE